MQLYLTLQHVHSANQKIKFPPKLGNYDYINLLNIVNYDCKIICSFRNYIVSYSRKRFFKVSRISSKHDSAGKQHAVQTSHSAAAHAFNRNVIRNAHYSRQLNALWVRTGMPYN